MPKIDWTKNGGLPMPEIVTVWAAADQQGDPFGALAKLLILTGQRLREVAGMEWSEVDLEARVWTLPSSRTKNGKEHIVPLADSAVAILKALKKAAPKNAVHVLSTNGKTPISGFSKAKRRLDGLVTKQREKQAKESGELPIPVQPWVLHDLRRSFATGAQALGIPVEHTEAVLNHVSGKRGGIVGVYQRYSYLGEKRAALEAWDRAVSLALAGKPGASLSNAAMQSARMPFRPCGRARNRTRRCSVRWEGFARRCRCRSVVWVKCS